MENKRVLTPQQDMARRTRRGFLALGAGAVAAIGGWEWLNRQPDQDGIPRPLRGMLGFNEGSIHSALYSQGHLAPTFPASSVGKLKENGDIGMEDDVPENWKLSLSPLGASAPARALSLADVKSLPKYDEIIEFKCIEGWSCVTGFTGARLSDFTARFAPGSEKAAYVGMNTPDENYYIGIEMASALHPQTLLAYEMNGDPLTDAHGAPLRLIVPVKYGIKNIKRIGQITYTDQRPDDYWAEQGYDYYSGL